MAPGGTGQQGQGSMLWNLFPLLLMLFALYFAIIRPQQRRQKQHDTLLKTLKVGDKVTTTSGIVGMVVGVKEKTVNIRSADTKLEVLKTAVSEITERGGDTAQPQS
jgi:preprotein translocase subunit YajC